ncbi:MAG: hypothetical protein WBC44_20930 [Planctomycetaceae bacterium]
MSPTLRSQVWKEWHERRWMFALASAWVLCGAIYAIVYELARGYHAPVASVFSACLLYGLYVPIFLAMRTSLGEVTQGTLAFTASLPVSLRQTAAVRMVAAAVTLVVPMIFGAVVLSVAVGTGFVEQMQQRPHDNYVPLPQRTPLPAPAAVGLVWKVIAMAAASATMLLLVLAIVGARRKSETVVGLIGAPLAMLWIMAPGIRFGENATASWANWFGALLPQSLVINYGYGDEVGSYTDLDIAPMVWRPLAANLLVLVLLGVWFARRYGSRRFTMEASARRRRRWPRLPAWLPNPIPGRLAALVWVDLRQAVPLAVAGLVLAVVMTLAEILLNPGSTNGGLALSVAGQLPGSTWIIATLWAAVVAAGVFGSELQPRLEDFWRSRPISPTTWFWTKYVVGLLAVLIVLDGVTILVSWGSPYADSNNRMSVAYVACMPLLHATVYSLTVLAVGLLRRPAFAAMAAVFAYFLATMVLESFPGLRDREPIHVYNYLFFETSNELASLWDRRYLITFGTLAAICVVLTVFAWRAARAPRGGLRYARSRSRTASAAGG